MREAIHIFRKDTRHLRYPIGILLMWTVMFVVASASAPPLYQPGSFSAFAFIVQRVSTYVPPGAWWFLISQAFHAEALPGDRQFWVTRPYSRASLFVAKALFVLAYITLPMAMAQGAILAWRGFPLGPYVPGLVWAQVLALAVVLLPAVVVASLTSTLVQFVLVGVVAAPLLFVGNDLLQSWAAVEWVRSSVAIGMTVAVTGSVLFVQFTRRRTGASRIIALGGILALVVTLPLISWRLAFAVQTRVTHAGDGSLTFELLRPPPRTDRQSDVMNPIALSFRVVGPPAGTPIACEAEEVSIDSPDGRWSTGLMGIGQPDTATRMPDGCTVFLPMPGVFFDKVADRPVNVHAILYLTVFGAERSTRVPIDQAPTVIPNVGVCAGRTTRRFTRVGGETIDQSATFIGCETAFRAPRGLILFSATGRTDPLGHGSYSGSPFPADLRLYPIDDAGELFPPIDAVTVTTREVVGHVRTVVDVRDVHLPDFKWALPR